MAGGEQATDESRGYATSMTMAAIVIGLTVTENMNENDQNIVANLLFAAAQAISTRASLIGGQGGAQTPSILNVNRVV